ncbi:MAG: serine/threonine protein kinase [Pirellulaceae bacterium]|nr:serine/threonine protein kinase [Pirellulaceae bacterium]
MSTETTGTLLQASGLASGLVSRQQLDYCLRVARHRLTQQGVSQAELISDRLLADILVEQEIVTAYQADQLLTGRTRFSLGSYVITDWIGQGGMGQVFKAVHHVMGRICAVKVLPQSRATSESRRNFVHEIRMQAALDCPYLVRAYDAGQDGNVHYLVTEFVPGMDLRRLVKSHGPLAVSQAAKIIMHAALGLDYAHRTGLVHRDVKPGNILVTPDGDAKVSDVGLAGFAKDLVSDPRAGKIVGTADYLSPEQIRTPLQVQSVSDIYSLGCTLYYAVSGKVPFPGGDTKSKLRRHLEDSPMHPRRFVPDIAEDFVDIIADMMEKDASKRIASAAQVAARLEPWISDEHSLGTIGMTRSPWMAPPPPSHEEISETSLVDDGRSQASIGQSLQGTERSLGSVGTDGALGSDAAESTNIPRPDRNPSACDSLAPDLGLLMPSGGAPAAIAAGTPSLPESMLTPPSIQPTTSAAMIVAVTVAIVVPLALLLGAILGYIVASR